MSTHSELHGRYDSEEGLWWCEQVLECVTLVGSQTSHGEEDQDGTLAIPYIPEVSKEFDA